MVDDEKKSGNLSVGLDKPEDPFSSNNESFHPDKRVPEEHVFHFRDGRRAHSLADLYDAINHMTDDEFNHHVTPDNNDFANWVEFVYHNPSLASELRKVFSKDDTLKVLREEINKFRSPQPHANPVRTTTPPLVLEDHEGKEVHTVNTVAPHHFIIKEFVYGMIFGLVLGLVLVGVLFSLGVFP